MSCRGKPGLAAAWLSSLTGQALMLELDAMQQEDVAAALVAMRPRQAADLLEARRPFAPLPSWHCTLHHAVHMLHEQLALASRLCNTTASGALGHLHMHEG